MTANLPDDIRELIRTQEQMLANPDAAADPPPPMATHLTRATVEAAITQLMKPPRPDIERAQREMALARWLDNQPPGAAERLLRHMYGEERIHGE